MSRVRDSQWYGEGDEDLADDAVTSSSTSAAPGGRLAQLERYSKKQMLNAPQRFNQIPVGADDSDLDSSEGEEEEQTNITSKAAVKEKEKATAVTTSSTTTTTTTTTSDNASMADVDDESKPKQPRKIQRFNKSYSDDEDEDAINEEDNKNSKERKVDKSLRARNREVVHIAKLRQQGIDFEDDIEEEGDDLQKIIENGEEEAEEEAGADGQMIQGSKSKQGYEEWKKTHMNRQVRADRVSRTSTTQDKTDSANTMASKLTEEEERAERYKKMRALFDRKKDDKLMSFEEDDPLKPRKGKCSSLTSAT